MNTACAVDQSILEHEREVAREVQDLQNHFGEGGHPDFGIDKETWARAVEQRITDLNYWEWVRYWIVSGQEI
jgi:hypothetical protein